MKKEILIHIGTHKTGSTSTQDFLAQNRNSLLESDGIFFPKSGTLCPKTGHHNIAWEILGNKRFNNKLGTLDDLLKELSSTNFKLAILSSEDFEFLTYAPDKLKLFDSILCSAGFNTNYFGFFRNTEGYATSLFFELKKRGLESDWPEFLHKVTERECVEYQNGWHFEFNRARFVSRWNIAIGDKFTCLDYDNVSKEPGVVAAFLEMAGASPETIKISRSAKRLNKTKKREMLYIYILSIIKKLTVRQSFRK